MNVAGYLKKMVAVFALGSLILYVLSVLDHRKPTSHSRKLVSESVPFAVNQDDSDKHIPTKVILLTYSRSGSSFLGELFNQNPNAFYYFEPLSGIYSYLYGIPFGMASKEYFKYKNGTTRYPPEYEASVINDQLNKLLSCDLNSVAVEVLQDRFTMHFQKQNKFREYRMCLGLKSDDKTHQTKAQNPTISQNGRILLAYQRNRKNYSNLLRRNVQLPYSIHHNLVPHVIKIPGLQGRKNISTYECKYFLKYHCGKYFDGHREFSCFNNVYGLTYPGSVLKTDSNGQILQNESYTRLFHGVNNSNKSHIRNHNSCVQKSKISSAKCQPGLIKTCMNSSIIAAKVIRLRMEAIGELLKIDPNVKVIHYFRDPRGVENSRSVGMRNKKAEMLRDAKMTCSKMMRDIRIRKDLEKMYPNTFMVLMYEDLATNPIETAKTVYKFLGHNMPQEVEDWLNANTNSKATTLDKNSLSTSRSNSSATAIRWMDVLSKETKEKLKLICQDVLNEFGLS